MKKQDTLIITSPQTNFKEIEFIRKNALLDWIKQQQYFEQCFSDGCDAEHGYKYALKDMEYYLNSYE